MEDAGASPVADFTYFGYPSTYMLSKAEIFSLFDRLDRRYANNPRNYWVVELADGIIQRETAMLLANPHVQSRIHRLLFTAGDAMGAIGGLEILKRQFGLQPDAISGGCSSAPLAVRELQEHTDIPVVSNMQRDLNQLLQVALEADCPIRTGEYPAMHARSAVISEVPPPAITWSAGLRFAPGLNYLAWSDYIFLTHLYNRVRVIKGKP